MRYLKKTHENGEEYVVFKVEKTITNIEPYEQYKSKGKDIHLVLVYPNPIRVTRDADGTFRHKGEKIEVVEDTKSISASYYTNSTSRTTAGAVFQRGYGKFQTDTHGVKFDKNGRGYFIDEKYGFPIPMSEFKKSQTAFCAFENFAAKLVAPKPVCLSTDPNEAKTQLDKLGINLSLVRTNNPTR